MQERERANILHSRGMKAAETHKWCEKELIVVFYEMDTFGGYRYFNAKNLYEYAMKVFKLSEPVALNLINIARKSKEVPAIRHAVVEGKISVSAARKMVPVITKDTAEAWIGFAATTSVREVEKAVAEINPKLKVRESAKFVAKDVVEVVHALDEEGLDKLKRVMDLESQSKRRAVTQGDAVVAGLDAYLAKHDPLLKAERVRDKKLFKAEHTRGNQSKIATAAARPTVEAETQVGINAVAPVTGQVKSKISLQVRTNSRSRLTGHVKYPAALTHAIDLRDGRRCTHNDATGTRCEERRWLHYHHVVERARGGRDTLENMITLCSAHHRMRHWLPMRPSTVRESVVRYH